MIENVRKSANLQKVLANRWKTIDEIANFSRFSGPHRVHIAVSLERAEYRGQVYYRWAAYHKRQPDIIGDITHDIETAMSDGLQHAVSRDESK